VSATTRSDAANRVSPGPATTPGGGGPTLTPRPRNATDPSGIAAEPLAADICVIGGGAGGIAVAMAAAALGRKVVLIEKNRMGGDSLNTGALPRAALLAAARRADEMRKASTFGIASVDPQIDHRAVHQRVKTAVAALAANSSVERLTGLGVRVVLGAARFLNKRTVLAGDYRITARRYVIATGASPALPPLPGLEGCPYFTTETVLDIERRLPHLVVVGAGATGLELAQAHARLGSPVTVLEQNRALSGTDPEAAAVVLKALASEGIEIVEGARAERVEPLAGAVRVHVATASGPQTLDGSHLLVATGRRPDLSDLNLTAAGIKRTDDGITVNCALRTSNSRVYAIGEATGAKGSADLASYHAGIVLRRMMFWLPAKADPSLIPRVAFTDPELAHVGLTEAEARAQSKRIQVLRWPMSEIDRAEAEHDTQGHIKVTTTPQGRILGATIVGKDAGELIQVWSLACSEQLNIKAMAAFVAPYPTRGEIGKRAAMRYIVSQASGTAARTLMSLVRRFG